MMAERQEEDMSEGGGRHEHETGSELDQSSCWEGLSHLLLQKLHLEFKPAKTMNLKQLETC